MNLFRKLRLGLWVIILAACVVIVLGYEVASHTVLSEATFKQWMSSSNGYVLARDELFTPQLLEKIHQDSNNTTFITDDMVRSAVQSGVTETVLKQKLDPIVEVVHDWLDSKRPDVTFSVDTSDVKAAFLTNLTAIVVRKAAALPVCDSDSTIADIESAMCRLSYISPDTMAAEIISPIKDHQSEILGDTLTQSDVSLPVHSTLLTDIPDYLNYLWTLALIAAGVFVVLALSLLLSRRLVGVVAVGLSGVIGGIAVLVAGVLVATQHFSFGDNQFVASLSTSALRSVTSEMERLGALTAATGLVVAVVGLGGWFWWKNVENSFYHPPPPPPPPPPPEKPPPLPEPELLGGANVAFIADMLLLSELTR